MKKNFVGIIVAVLIISGYGAVASSFTGQNSAEKTDTVVFSPVQLLEDQDAITVDLEIGRAHV